MHTHICIYTFGHEYIQNINNYIHTLTHTQKYYSWCDSFLLVNIYNPDVLLNKKKSNNILHVSPIFFPFTTFCFLVFEI